MADREPYKWITVKGKHIPVYKDEHGQDVFGVGQEHSPNTMSISDFKLEQKKWSDSELKDLDNAINNFSKDFGDMKDVLGTIYRRSLGSSSTGIADGMYDRDGNNGRGRATYFNTGSRIRQSTINHEFTHAITEEIASHAKEFGYQSRGDMFKDMLSLYYVHLGEKEPDWKHMSRITGRKYSFRPEEIFSQRMENYGTDRETKNTRATVEFLKMYWNRLGRKGN